MTLEPLSEHELLVFWAELLVLLFTARALGALMRAIKQPTVVGELLAGVVIGPSVFGRVAPDAWDWLFPPEGGGHLLAVSWIGVFLLLIVTGFETDLHLIRSLGRAVARVTIGSLVVPLVLGAVVGAVLPRVFLGDAHDRLSFTLFIAASVSISALAVMAKVLGDLRLSRRNVGQLMLATGMANDAAGWILLGVLAGLAQEGSVSFHLLIPIVGLAVFLGLAFTVGQRFVDFSLRSLRAWDAGISGSLTVTMVIALGAGVVTQVIGVEAVLGGFVAGVLLGRSKFQQPEVRHHLEGLTAGVFAPIFFATAGLRVDLQVLSSASIVAWTAVLTLVAFGAKLGGAYLGGRRADLPAREALALGLGLNARGTLEIVIATVAVTLGVFSDTAYTSVLVMVLVTSALAPPLLRLAVHNWPGTEEEQRRLDREETLSRNVLVKPERILLPSRGGENSRLTARIMNLAWPEGVEATVLSVGSDGRRADIDLVAKAFPGRPVERKHVNADDSVSAVLKQASLGYGVIAIGAVDRTEDGVISPMVDQLIARSTLPMVIVRRGRTEQPKEFRRILIPADGSRASRGAQEVAFNVAAKLKSDAVLVHVTKAGQGELVAEALSGGPPSVTAPKRRSGLRRLLRRGDDVSEPTPDEPAGTRILRAARERGDKVGVKSGIVVREGSTPADEIAVCAREIGADLIVLGATIREVDGRPFMGHSIEHLLEVVDATVVLVTSPRTTSD